MESEDCLLKVRNLNVSIRTRGELRRIVEDISLDVTSGQILVVLGESGSGKTTFCRALTRLFPEDLSVLTDGSVLFFQEDLLRVNAARLNEIRRHKIRYVFQGGGQALNPVRRIRMQMRDAVADRTADDSELVGILGEVGITNGKEVLDSFPHQLSGGMAQKVLIAMAILGSPDLIVADEPTSAVDAGLKYQILELFNSFRKKQGAGVIIITHDLDIAKSYGDRVILFYAGRVVETGARDDFFSRPLHPYARMLLESRQLLVSSQGGTFQVPSGDSHGGGCRFYTRCPIRVEDCSTGEPVLEVRSGGREVRCPF